MKKLNLLIAILLVSSSAFAVKVKKSRGTVETFSLVGSNEQSAIVITGAAAEKLFNDLSNDLLGSVDAGENDGVRTMLKIGENFACYLSIPQTGKNSYECIFTIENKSSGTMSKGAAG